MFEVGFSELFLLSIVALLVLGPERLPALARTLGGLVRKARSSWYSLKRSIETEMAAADISEPLRSTRTELDRVSRELSQSIDDLAKPGQVADAAKPDRNDAEGSGTPPPAS